MIIKRATKQDLPALRALMDTHGKCDVDESLFNNRDIALQARLDTGELVGFLWCGLMAKNTLGYVNKFTIHPALTGKKVGEALGKAFFEECLRRKVKMVMGIVRHDQYFNKVAMNALKHAFKSTPETYALVYSNINESLQELKKLGR